MPKWREIRHALEEYEEDRYYDEQDDGTMEQKMLLSCARAFDLNQVRRIIARGINLNFCDQFGETLLHIVASFPPSPDVVETVEHLVYFGAPVERCDRFGQTPLHIASQKSADVVRILLDAGSPVNVQDNAGITSLMLSCLNPCPEALTIVQFLLDRGANAKLKDKDSQSALHYACKIGGGDIAVRKEIVYKLLYAGTPVNLVDVRGASALYKELLHVTTSDTDDFSSDQLQVFTTLLRGGAHCEHLSHVLKYSQLSTVKQCRLCVRLLKIAEPLMGPTSMLMLFSQICHLKLNLETPNPALDEVYNCLHTAVRSVHSLKALSRIAVRRNLNGCVLPNVDKLGLPATLEEYVSFQGGL